MRTTIVLPPALLRAAKMRSAELGETLKTLFERALTAELAAGAARPHRQSVPVRLPVIGDPAAPKVAVAGRHLDAALADADAVRSAGPRRPGQRRRRARR